VYIDGSPTTDWKGVVVNGVRFSTDGIRECVTTFFAVFAAFNLIHPYIYDSLLEVLEFRLKLRERLSKQAAKVFISTFSFKH
jgi:hypothetical protein